MDQERKLVQKQELGRNEGSEWDGKQKNFPVG